MDAEQLADGIWYASVMFEPGEWDDDTGKNDSVTETPEPGREEEPPPDESAADPKPERNDASAEERHDGDLFAKTTPIPGFGKTVAGTEVAISSRHSKIVFEKAIRPLRGIKTPSRKKKLDPTKTAERIAELDGRFIEPVFSPTKEPQITGIIVVEQTPIMRLWQKAVDDLVWQFRQSGAFRRIAVWNLKTRQTGTEITLSAAARGSGRELQPESVGRDSLQPVYLIVSDFLSAGWRSGATMKLLNRWGKHSPVAALSVLPDWLWHQSEMRKFPLFQVRSRFSLSSNRRLTGVEKPVRDPVSLITWNPESMANWVRLVQAGGDNSGLAFGAHEELGEMVPARRTVDLSTKAESLFEQFETSASAQTRRLAEVLSACPLILPVIELVRARLVPEAGLEHLTELFLSGLVFRPKSESPDTAPELICYDFLPGVADWLLDNLRRSEALDVLEAMSGEAVDFLDGTRIDFRAILEGGGSEVEISPHNRPFARVGARVLRRFGERYSKAAETLEEAAGDSRKGGPNPVNSRQGDQYNEDFEKRVQLGGSIDPVTDRRFQQLREVQVCRVEIPTSGSPELGTGFLIGPSVILTACHLIENFAPEKGRGEVVFDYIRESDNLEIRNVKRIQLAKDPIVAKSLSALPDRSRANDTLPTEDELDFVVLKLEKPVGRERGWCVLPKEKHKFRPGEDMLTVLQFPRGGPLQKDINRVVGLNENGTRVHYTTNTEAGASGSPCFDKRWNVVALHHNGLSRYSQGIPTHLIRAFLERNQLWNQLRADEDQSDVEKAFLAGQVFTTGSSQSEIENAVDSFRSVFRDAREVIEILGVYKHLHDVLHVLQFRCHAPLRRQIQTSAVADVDWIEVEDAELTLRQQYASVEALIGHPGIPVNEGRDFAELGELNEKLNAAIDAESLEILKKVTWGIERVTTRQMPNLNARINETAAKLNADILLEGLSEISSHLHRTESEEAASFLAGLEAFQKLHAKFEHVVNSHNAWQNVENQLRLMSGEFSRGPEYLEVSWNEIQALIKPKLAADDSSVAAKRFDQAVRSLDNAIADPSTLIQPHYDRVFREVSNRFFVVDMELKELCDQFSRLAAEIEDLLSTLR